MKRLPPFSADTRTVRPPPLPAFVFLPPKHFWPLALAAVGLRVDDRRKHTLKTDFWRWLRAVELLRKNSSWETSLQGQCHSPACLSLLKKGNSDLAFQGGLAPVESLPEPGGLSSAVGPPAKPKSQLDSEQSQNQATAALPLVSPRFGLILRAMPNLELQPPPQNPPHSQHILGKRSCGGQSWEQCAALGIRAPPPVPAGELKHSPLQAFSLLLASKAFSLIHLHGSAPPTSPSRLQVPPSTPLRLQPSQLPCPPLPGHLPPPKPFLGNLPLSPADTHGIQTCRHPLGLALPDSGSIGYAEESTSPYRPFCGGTFSLAPRGKPI